MAGLAAIVPALTAAGTVLSTVGMIQQGRSAKAVSEYEARQLEQRANTERALSQRRANEERRKKEFAISRARAVGAASGGGVDLNLIGQLEQEGELRAGYAIWEGEEAARGRAAQAAARRFEGASTKRGANLNAFGALLSGGQSFLEKYG